MQLLIAVYILKNYSGTVFIKGWAANKVPIYCCLIIKQLMFALKQDFSENLYEFRRLFLKIV